jgi:hypothetical protein
MPEVRGKKYPYTPAGMAAADYAKKKRRGTAKPAMKRRPRQRAARDKK